LVTYKTTLDKNYFTILYLLFHIPNLFSNKDERCFVNNRKGEEAQALT
jgi:hypothetical protein